MVKEIFLKHFTPNESFLGTFLDESNFDVLVNEDCDVYKPSSFGDPRAEENVLLKFRKNYFSEEEQRGAYVGFRDGTTASHNRGISAGVIADSIQKQKPTSEKGRSWLTDYQSEVLDFFMQPANEKLFYDDTDTLEHIRQKYLGNKEKVSTLRGYVWLTEKVEANKFVFDDWASEVYKKSKDEQASEARWIMEELISGTNYANPVYSGVAGYYDRYPRIPYCRETSYTALQKEKFEKGIPFIETLSDGFKRFLPERYGNQLRAIESIDQSFRIGRSVYTTLTLNKNFRTAAHRDAGDLPNGFGNLTAVSENGWEGGYLCFPEYRAAVNVRPGDLLLMDVHQIHGNTPIKGIDGNPPDRISIVAYFRENMFQCSIKKYEDLRKNFVDFRKNNTKHAEWREHWNGISPSMFSSEEWYNYVVAIEGEDFLRTYHPEAFEETLDDFFE